VTLKRGLALVILISLLSSLPVYGAQRSSKSPGGTSVDETRDNFCQFDGNSGHKSFQCEEKRPYPLGTPCLCPGSDQIGKITHH
jgi:hypothetical protein